MECSKVTIPCEMCMEMMPRGSVHNHMTDTCPKVVIPCPFAEHGCTQKMTRNLLQQHMTQASSNHLMVLI